MVQKGKIQSQLIKPLQAKVYLHSVESFWRPFFHVVSMSFSFTKISLQLFKPIDSGASHNHYERWPLLTLSPLSKIGIIYTQVLQEEKTHFPVNPDQSDRLNAAWDIHKKSLEIWAAKFPATALTGSYSQNCLDDAFKNVWSGSKLSRRSTTAAQR